MIFPDGTEYPVFRPARTNVIEQLRVVRAASRAKAEALVVECMALKPAYQRISEERIVQSTIGVLTNVREDHQDVMGETLPEIARSLLSTCPRNGILVTSEQNPEILEIMGEVAASKGTELVVADPDRVTDEEVARFDYIAFKPFLTRAPYNNAEIVDIKEEDDGFDEVRAVNGVGLVGSPSSPEAWATTTAGSWSWRVRPTPRVPTTPPSMC